MARRSDTRASAADAREPGPPEPPAGREVHRSKQCFVCGTDNGAGLGLGLVWDGRRARARYVPDVKHRGYGAVLHGGILCAILDEAICVAIGERVSGKMVTLRLEARYHRPVLVGRPVVIEGWFTRTRGRIHFGAGQILDAETGKRCTSARLSCITLPEERTRQFQGPWRR